VRSLISFSKNPLEGEEAHDPGAKTLAQGSPGSPGRAAFVATINGLHVLTRNSAVAMVGGLVAQAIKFAIYIYLARKFTSVEFGLISFGIAVNAFVSIVGNFGLPVFGTREVATKGYVPRHLLFTVAGARSILALLATAVAVGALGFLPGVTGREYILVAGFGLSNVPLAGLFDWAFQGLGRLDVSAALNVVWQAFWLAFTWAGVQLGAGLLVVPSAYCVSAFLAAMLSFVWLRYDGLVAANSGPLCPSFRESWKTLKAAAPLGVGTMLITVLIWTDAILVRLLRGEQAIGQYAAGNRAALAVAMLSSFYIQGVFPFFSKAAETSHTLFQRYFQHAYNDLSLLFFPGAIWGIFNARAIMQFLFKRPEYVAASHVFQIFQVVMLLTVLNALFGTGILVAFHRDRAYQNVLLATAVFFLLTCPVLTFRWGIVGAAAAALGAQAFSFASFLWRTRSFAQPAHLVALVWPSAAGLAAGLASWKLHLSLLPAGLLLLAAYSVLALARFRATHEGRYSTEVAG
jgi:O-antigen/teichoic acid export membrane protein